MKPHPNISQQQSQSCKEIPHNRVSCTSADFCLIDLSIRGFDSKSFPVSFLNPFQRLVLYSPGSIKQGFPSRCLPASFQVATHYGKIKADFTIFGILDCIFHPTTFLPQSEILGSRSFLCWSLLFASLDCRHNKRTFVANKIANASHRVKSSIQQKKFNPHSQLLQPCQDLAEDCVHLLLRLDPIYRQSVSLPIIRYRSKVPAWPMNVFSNKKKSVGKEHHKAFKNQCPSRMFFL